MSRRVACAYVRVARWLLVALFGAPLVSITEAVPRWDNSALLGAGSPPMPFVAEEIFSDVDLARPLFLLPFKATDLGDAVADENDRYLVGLRSGQLLELAVDRQSGKAKVSVAFDLPDPPRPEGMVGRSKRPSIFGAVFHPKFPEVPHLYFVWNDEITGQSRNFLTRLTATAEVTKGGALVFEPASRLEIIDWKTEGHNGCDLHFGPNDGMLYLSSGDGQAPGDPANTGQRTDDLLGSILRIDVAAATDTSPYRIPEDNPFVGMNGVRPEIWSYGFRNPWRMVFHPTTHELFVGDNGDTKWEMVHRVAKGGNAGWSAFEGSSVFRPQNLLSGPTKIHTRPLVEHPHSEMRSIIGGVFYHGTKLEGMAGEYLYGCYATHGLWAFNYQDGQVVGKARQVAKLGHDVVHVVIGHDGEPIITCYDGTILGLKPNPDADQLPRPLPATLSETGLYRDTAKQALADGVVPYEINAESWSDGATKTRAFAMPEVGADNRKGFWQPRGAEALAGWFFPQGTAVMQTLSLADRPIETQIMFLESGSWTGSTYRWRTDGSDADLVPIGGLEVDLPDDLAEVGLKKWRFPSRGECTICHTQRTGFLVAMKADQLNRDHQLQKFLADELVHPGGLPRDESKWGRLPEPHNPATGDLESRARAYLHVNCSHCHRETGLGGRAEFELMHWLSLDETGLIGASPMVGLSGTPESKIIRPGVAEHSELLHRMSLRGPGQMPLLGSQIVDEQGVALIREWIESMESE